MEIPQGMIAENSKGTSNPKGISEGILELLEESWKKFIVFRMELLEESRKEALEIHEKITGRFQKSIFGELIRE